MSTPESSLIAKFFLWTFGKRKGYINIAYQHGSEAAIFKNAYFEWPKQKNELVAFIDQQRRHHHVWFSVALLSKPERKAVNALETDIIYADLDACHPDKVVVPPHAVIESSPERYQALWRLDAVIDPYEAQAIAKRVAYAYADEGADRSGWDSVQLLRVPFTYNFKPHYLDEEGRPPKVQLLDVVDERISRDAFDVLPEITTSLDLTTTEAPNPAEYPSPEELIGQYFPSLRSKGFTSLYSFEPELGADWSANMWRLINVCLEANMSAEEAYIVCLSAKCNKYVRDGRPISHLWKEVLKAAEYQASRGGVVEDYDPDLVMPVLIMPEDEKKLPKTIIDDYVNWASAATDAAPVYHSLSFYCGLSMLVSSGLKLELAYDTLHANIWGLILGDSTLTRKTTAMKMVMTMVEEIDPDVVVATDASSEGLLSNLQSRSGQVSVYYRDEVSGFFEGVQKKEYLSGMPELMANLYDVPKTMRRKLRKESISVERPFFIFFGGGIKHKVFNVVDEQLFLSGFLPRFLIVSGETDTKRLRRTAPPTKANTSNREDVKKELARLNMLYARTEEITIAGQTTSVSAITEVQLTEKAWERYQAIEEKMVEVAYASSMSDIALPCFERLSRSLLKLTMLTATLRHEPEDNVLVADEQDLLYAARYVQEWGKHTVEMILQGGKDRNERLLDKIHMFIKETPGTDRSAVMRRFAVDARAMTNIQETLEQRGMILVKRDGKKSIYHAN